MGSGSIWALTFGRRTVWLRFGKILCMKYPERLIQALQSHLGAMNEAQVVDSLRAVEAVQDHEREMLAWLKSVSLASKENSTGEIEQLKSDLNLYRRPRFSPFIWGLFEEALKKWLESLRKRPSNDA